LRPRPSEHKPKLHMNLFPFIPLPGESPLAFEGFVTWFNLKDRKLKLVAEAIDVNISTVKNWSAEFGWANRLLKYKAQLMGNRAQAEAEVVKNQALAQADLEIQELKDRAIRIQQMRETHQRLFDEYILHSSDKTRLHELTGFMMAIEKVELMGQALHAKMGSNNSSKESDAEFEEELQRAYGELAKNATPPPDLTFTDGAGI
jgi:hypothetical protein